MKIEIDKNSGFCFGVVRAINEAEKALKEGSVVYSLGDIVHNKIEVRRLEQMGLKSVDKEQMGSLRGRKLLVRAHGEPPRTYKDAETAGISIIDATCPVVAQLQLKVKQAYDKMSKVDGQVVILGKKGHAEVVGLTGQVEDKVLVIERFEDLEFIDFNRPIYLLSQTTQSVTLFKKLADEILKRSENPLTVTIADTICRQMSNREAHLRDFAERCDIIIFVCGKESSNGRVLFEVCAGVNPKSYKIESSDELDRKWFENGSKVGICGATSTPKWLMQQVANDIELMVK